MKNFISPINSFKPYLRITGKKNKTIFRVHFLVDIPDYYKGEDITVVAYGIRLEDRTFRSGVSKGKKIIVKLFKKITDIDSSKYDKIVYPGKTPFTIYEKIRIEKTDVGEVSVEVFVDGTDLPSVQGSGVVNYDDADDD